MPQPYTKPITIQANSPEEATRVADAIKNFLVQFSNSEIITMSEAVKKTVTKTMIKSYLK